MIIQEVWAFNPEELNYKPLKVINLYKASRTEYDNGLPVTFEFMMAICFNKENGEIIETPVAETIVKTIYDKENNKYYEFRRPKKKEL